MNDNKTAYNRKDYPVHSSGPWSVTAGVVPDRKGRLIVEDCLMKNHQEKQVAEN